MNSNERMRELAFSEMEMMPAASNKGSQPYSYPNRGCEMAGKG